MGSGKSGSSSSGLAAIAAQKYGDKYTTAASSEASSTAVTGNTSNGGTKDYAGAAEAGKSSDGRTQLALDTTKSSDSRTGLVLDNAKSSDTRRRLAVADKFGSVLSDDDDEGNGGSSNNDSGFGDRDSSPGGMGGV